MFKQQLFQMRLNLSFLSLLVIFNNCCSAEKATAGSEGKQQKQEQPAVKAAEQLDSAGKSDIVAKIGDYVITEKDLQQRLATEIHPYNYGYSDEQSGNVDVNGVLLQMIAEKAMVMEGRKQGYLQDEETSVIIDRFKNRRLANQVWVTYISGRKSELEVTQEEIDKQTKDNPKLNQAQAKAFLQGQKANRILEQYYSQLCQKYHLKKESGNFPKAIDLHDRLLNRPKEPRKQPWIFSTQIKNELTPEEKSIVLAAYDGGTFTIKDFLYALMEMSPPGRPKDLNTEKGVESLLDRFLRLTIFVAEAKSLGLDKDKKFLDDVRLQEDMSLLGKVITEKVKPADANEPAEEQIKAYFEKNKGKFGKPRMLKIDQIWCSDLEMARKVKAELEVKDFNSVKMEFSLQKQSKPFDTTAGNEGLFFKDLWQADPNQIVGPIKGFYSEGLKWRIVKILEKKPAEAKEYSADMKDLVKLRIMDEWRNTTMANYRKELLQKYPYEIYAEKIKDIDPLSIP